MPGKVNPIIPEVVNQVAFEVIGNDVTVTMAAESGQLELNAFEPIMFKSILTSEQHLTRALIPWLKTVSAALRSTLMTAVLKLSTPQFRRLSYLRC